MRKTLLQDKMQDSLPDPVENAVKREKKRLQEKAELKKKQKELEIEYFNVTPSRVKVDAGKELIIESKPLLYNIFRYIFSRVNLGNFGTTIGYGMLYYILFIKVVSFLVSKLGIPINERLIMTGASLFALISWGRWYVVKSVKKIAELNEPFHLKVSGKNFMVHSRNPEKYIAASTKVDSDGEWNIMAEIDEVKGSLSFTWAYGPDINNQTVDSRKFTKHLQLSQPYLNLSDIELIRKFLKDNGIEITSDRRINE